MQKFNNYYIKSSILCPSIIRVSGFRNALKNMFDEPQGCARAHSATAGKSSNRGVEGSAGLQAEPQACARAHSATAGKSSNRGVEGSAGLLHTYLPSKPLATLRPLITVAPISPPVVISSDTSVMSLEIAIVTRTGTTTVPQPPRSRTALPSAEIPPLPTPRRRRGQATPLPLVEHEPSSSPHAEQALPSRSRRKANTPAASAVTEPFNG
jgi:hypothetical protein